MREIKFRAWSKEQEFWFEPDEICISFEYGILDRFFSPIEDKLEVMQYTGLKDKNGLPIYEGDLVKYWDYDKPLEVIYCEDCASFRLQLPDYGNNEPIDTNKDLQVIGNIYENATLLSSKREGKEKEI